MRIVADFCVKLVGNRPLDSIFKENITTSDDSDFWSAILVDAGTLTKEVLDTACDFTAVEDMYLPIIFENIYSIEKSARDLIDSLSEIIGVGYREKILVYQKGAPVEINEYNYAESYIAKDIGITKPERELLSERIVHVDIKVQKEDMKNRIIKDIAEGRR